MCACVLKAVFLWVTGFSQKGMNHRPMYGETGIDGRDFFFGEKNYYLIVREKKPHKAGATTFSLINDIPIHK